MLRVLSSVQHKFINKLSLKTNCFDTQLSNVKNQRILGTNLVQYCSFACSLHASWGNKSLLCTAQWCIVRRLQTDRSPSYLLLSLNPQPSPVESLHVADGWRSSPADFIRVQTHVRANVAFVLNIGAHLGISTYLLERPVQNWQVDYGLTTYRDK